MSRVPSCFQNTKICPEEVPVVASVTAGVALVHGAIVQAALVGDGGVPGTTADCCHRKPRPNGTPTVYLTWFAGPRQPITTTFLWSGKNTTGAANDFENLIHLGRNTGLVQPIVPSALVSPCEYHRCWSRWPVQTISSAWRPSGSVYEPSAGAELVRAPVSSPRCDQRPVTTVRYL